MSALATSERAYAEPSAPAPRMFRVPAGSTLEDKILDAWEDLTVEGSTDCPVCGDSLGPQGCLACGSQLS